MSDDAPPFLRCQMCGQAVSATNAQAHDEIRRLRAQLAAAEQRIKELQKIKVEANRLYRYFNGLDVDDWDKRAEHLMVTMLDGLSVGPLNRNGVKADLATHFADIAATVRADTIEECEQTCLDEMVNAEATDDPGDHVYNQACEHCANAIRALAGKPKSERTDRGSS